MQAFTGLSDTWTATTTTTSEENAGRDPMLDWSLRELLIHTCPSKWIYPFNVIYSAGILNTPIHRLGTMENWMERNIVPRPQNLFSMFARVDPDKIRVIFLFQDPYPSFRADGTPKAIGRALEGMQNLPGYAKDDIIPPSLKQMHLKLKEEYPEIILPDHGCLDRWYDQGVFLLNVSLTCVANEPKSHVGMWEGFIESILDYINNIRTVSKKQLIVVAFGKEAAKLKTRISGKIVLIESAHPSPMSRKYFAQSRFYREVNQRLRDMDEAEIDWRL